MEHLNAAIDLLDAHERLELAHRNLAALRQAKRSAAFANALMLANHGVRCLTAQDWSADYQSWFDLHRERAELLFLNGDFLAAEIAARELVDCAATPLDQALAHSVLLQQYNMQARYQEAIETARQALLLVGVDFPTTGVEQRQEAEFQHSLQLAG